MGCRGDRGSCCQDWQFCLFNLDSDTLFHTTTMQGSVQQLKEMFPTLETEVIESILQAKGGNVDAALSHLLELAET